MRTIQRSRRAAPRAYALVLHREQCIRRRRPAQVHTKLAAGAASDAETFRLVSRDNRAIYATSIGPMLNSLYEKN